MGRGAWVRRVLRVFTRAWGMGRGAWVGGVMRVFTRAWGMGRGAWVRGAMRVFSRAWGVRVNSVGRLGPSDALAQAPSPKPQALVRGANT